MDFVTTLPAPIIAPSPISTPGKIVQSEPIHTFLPIFTCFGEIFCLLFGLKS